MCADSPEDDEMFAARPDLTAAPLFLQEHMLEGLAAPSITPSHLEAAARIEERRAARTNAGDSPSSLPLQTRFNNASQDAMDVLECILTDPKEKTQLKRDIAIWLLEKVSGKPKQEIDHQSSTLSQMIELLEKTQRSGAILDITPKQLPPSKDADSTDGAGAGSPATRVEAPEDEYDTWIRENL